MDSRRIELARQRIAQAARPISFSGAGLSAESGIATFRDKSDDALWAKFDPAQLASQDGFRANPSLVIDWYNQRRESVAAAKPNAAHKALGGQHGWHHITQNVDHLLEVGGADPDIVFHLHGSLYEDHCNGGCGHCEKIDMANPPGLRNCAACGDQMRPSVVWFGEALSNAVFERAVTEVESADLMLVVGTSARVMPAANLIRLARQNDAEIIIVNTEASESVEDGDIELVGKASELLARLFS